MGIIRDTFANNLKRLREATGLKQDQLGMLVWPGKNAESARVQISKYERGVQDPKEKTKIKLAGALGVHVLQLTNPEVVMSTLADGLPKDPVAEKIGLRLRARRLELGMSPAQVSEAAGVEHLTPQAVEWYEEGVQVPSEPFIKGMAFVLKIDWHKLAGEAKQDDDLDGELAIEPKGGSLDLMQMLKETRRQLRETQIQVDALLVENQRLTKENLELKPGVRGDQGPRE